MLQTGPVLDKKCQIEAAIGQGGFGYVYRARERLTRETVAIKELVPTFVDQPEMVERFIQEARGTLRLTHPPIVRSQSIFEDRGTLYLVMEYLPGGPLADALERGPQPVNEVVRVATELCQALAYAHGLRCRPLRHQARQFWGSLQSVAASVVFDHRGQDSTRSSARRSVMNMWPGA